MAVLLHERPRTAGGKTRKTPNLPKTSAVVALFAFSSRLDRDTMSLFAKTHSDEVRAAGHCRPPGRRCWNCCTAGCAQTYWCWTRC